MSHFDLPLDELRRYRPDVAVPDDLDEFWRETLGRAREFELAAQFTPVDTGLVAVETFDVTFAGYGGGRGLPHERLFWSAAGYANLVMDTQVEPVFRTLSHFDGAVLARRPTAPALFSVALMDDICPPSTVLAAYHHYGATDKDIVVYPYNEHEGGQGFQEAAQLRWLATRCPSGTSSGPSGC